MLSSLNEKVRGHFDEMKSHWTKAHEKTRSTMDIARQHVSRVPEDIKEVLGRARQELLKALDIPRKDDLDMLAKRLDEVEARMAALGNRSVGRAKDTSKPE